VFGATLVLVAGTILALLLNRLFGGRMCWSAEEHARDILLKRTEQQAKPPLYGSKREKEQHVEAAEQALQVSRQDPCLYQSDCCATRV